LLELEQIIVMARICPERLLVAFEQFHLTLLRMPRITSCRYSHIEREAGISDHSVLILEVE